jgi:hypothetical protein
MDQLLGRARTDRTRHRFFVSLALVAVAMATFGLLAPSAGAHGTGISADCWQVTAVKPMDTVRVRFVDSYEKTFDVDSTLVFVFPLDNPHGAVNGVYVTFDDGEKADVPVPLCPTTTTTTTRSSTSTSTSTSSPSSSTTAPSTTTTSTAGSTTSTTGGGSSSTTAASTSSTVGGLGSTTTVRSAGGAGTIPTTTSPRIAGAGAGTTPTTAAGAKPAATGSSLPFTGGNLTVLWVGLAALGTGGALYVNTRRRSV